MSDSRLIGVFDSGIGGLTVVKALRDLLPNEKIFYVGDTARVPYGGKSASTVERYSLEIADILIEENAKILVVACNTASSVALRKLEEHLPVPVTGVIRPGARAAVAATRNHHIGVIGTRATIKSGAYERELRALNPGVHISVRACPLLVPLIEEAWLDDELTDRVIGRYLEPLVMEGIVSPQLCNRGTRTFGSTTIARAIGDSGWFGNRVNRYAGQFSAGGPRGAATGDRRNPITRSLTRRIHAVGAQHKFST